MRLEGSCQCGAVTFRVDSPHPFPYQRCYCSVCRKTQGGGGYAINLGADFASLRVTGRQHITVYHARLKDPEDARAHRSPAERHFCGTCGSALWSRDPATGATGVRLGAFDGDPGVRPQYRQFVAYAAAWEEVPDDGLPHYDERPS